MTEYKAYFYVNGVKVHGARMNSVPSIGDEMRISTKKFRIVGVESKHRGGDPFVHIDLNEVHEPLWNKIDEIKKEEDLNRQAIGRVDRPGQNPNYGQPGIKVAADRYEMLIDKFLEYKTKKVASNGIQRMRVLLQIQLNEWKSGNESMNPGLAKEFYAFKAGYELGEAK